MKTEDFVRIYVYGFIIYAERDGPMTPETVDLLYTIEYYRKWYFYRHLCLLYQVNIIDQVINLASVLIERTMAKQLLLVGDSNVRRFFNQLGSAYSASVDLVQARNLTEWSEAIPACKRGYE